MSLYATPAMRRAFERYVDEGIITKDAYVYSVVRGYSKETQQKLKEKLRAKAATDKARLAIQGAPLLYRESEPLRNSNDPTFQWLDKGGKRVVSDTVGKGEVIAAKRFRLRNLIEQYRGYLGEVRVRACERFVYDASYALRVRVANHQPTGGGSPNRLGGIGNRPQHERNAVARHEWVMRHLCAEAKLAAKYLVTCEILNADGSLATFEDFGRKMTPDVKLKGRLWGEGFGVLWLLSSELVHLYAICPIAADPFSETEREMELGYMPEKRAERVGALA